MKTLFVGIDASQKEMIISLIEKEGRKIEKPLRLANNQFGAQALERKLVEIANKEGFSHLKIATESASFYDFHLADFLAESKELAKFKAEIYRFNPKLTHNFKKALQDLEKTDLIDSQVIAERLRFGSLPSPYHSLKEYFPLQRLIRYRFKLVENIVREKSFLLSHLFLKFSAFNSNKPIKRILGETSRAIISQYLTPEEIAQADIEELIELISQKSKKRIKNSKEIAKLIQETARQSYQIKENLAHCLNLIINSSFRTIRAYQDSLKEINKAITDQLKAFPQTLISIPGIGNVFAAGILAEIGDIERFKSKDALAKYAGLWWPKNQSGEFESKEKRLRKTGNKYLRYYLVEAANSLRIHNQEYKRFYQKKYQEVRYNQHKRALVLTARKFVRLVFALLKTGKEYQKEKKISS